MNTELIILFLITIFGLVCLCNSFFIVNKSKSSASILFISLLLFFHSYIFINIRNYHENYYYFYSAWKEITITGLFLFIFLNSKYHQKIKSNLIFFIIISLLTIYGILTGFYQGFDTFKVFLSARDIMFPVYFFYFFSLVKLKDINFKSINTVLILIFSIHTIYGLYNYLTFDGNPYTLWFYDYLESKGNNIGFEYPNHIRNNHLRSAGMFTSPIEYSLNLVFLVFISIYYLVFQKKTVNSIYFTISSLFFILGIYISQVRTSLIVLLMGLCVFFGLYKTNLSSKNKKILSFTIPFALVIGSIVYLSSNLSGFMVDESALGRIDQYLELTNLVINQPLGYGFGNIGTKGEYAFDSNLIICLLAFNLIGGIIYLSIYVFIFFKLLDSFEQVKGSDNQHLKVLYFSIISYFICSIYFFAFQYTIPGAINYFILMISGILINKLSVRKNLTDT